MWVPLGSDQTRSPLSFPWSLLFNNSNFALGNMIFIPILQGEKSCLYMILPTYSLYCPKYGAATLLWQRYAFRRNKCAGPFLASNTCCFAVSMFDECASPITHTMQPVSCAFFKRYCESPTLAGRFLPATCRGG